LKQATIQNQVESMPKEHISWPELPSKPYSEVKPYVPPIPFPQRLKQRKMEQENSSELKEIKSPIQDLIVHARNLKLSHAMMFKIHLPSWTQ